MNIKIRPFLLAAGALLLATSHASAQFVELVTEAPVTLSAVLTVPTSSETETSRRITAVAARLSHAQILEELLSSGVIPDETTAGWRLVAVSHAPADLKYVQGAFFIYAVKTDFEPVLVPDSKFFARSYQSVEKYKERHLGQYVLDSAGTVTNHVSYDYRPSFNVGDNSFNISESLTDGFATIAYKTKDAGDGFETFFYAINSVRATVRGSFQAETNGLITFTVSIGAAKLVDASRYPDVPTFPGLEDSE